MSDIVERLRAFAGDTPGWAHAIFGEAADEIERLRTLVKDLADDLEAVVSSPALVETEE